MDKLFITTYREGAKLYDGYCQEEKRRVRRPSHFPFQEKSYQYWTPSGTTG